MCNFLVEIDFSNSDGSDFLRDLLGQRSMMRERDLSGPAEQNGLNGPRLTLPHIIFNILFVTSIYQFTNPQILLSKNYRFIVFSGLKSSYPFQNFIGHQNAFHSVIKIFIIKKYSWIGENKLVN